MKILFICPYASTGMYTEACTVAFYYASEQYEESKSLLFSLVLTFRL